MKVSKEVRDGYRELFKNALRDPARGMLPFPPSFRQWVPVGKLVAEIDDTHAINSLEDAVKAAMRADDAAASFHLMQFIVRASDWYAELWAESIADEYDRRKELEE